MRKVGPVPVGRGLAAVVLGVGLLFGHGATVAQDDSGDDGSSVTVDAGELSESVAIDIGVAGGTGTGSAGGGDENAASVRIAAGDMDIGAELGADPVAVEGEVAVGNGGSTLVGAEGGDVETGVVEVGGNAAGEVLLGETSGGLGGDAGVAISGPELTVGSDINVDAGGGVVLADGAGGSANIGTFNATAVDFAVIGAVDDAYRAQVLGRIEAGDGGLAVGEANGGTITIEGVRSGRDVGGVISVGGVRGGDTCPDCTQGGDAIVLIRGGRLTATTVVGVDAAGGLARTGAAGGGENVAGVEVTAVAAAIIAIGATFEAMVDVEATAGNGGATAAAARGGSVLLGDVTGGGTSGHVITVAGVAGGGGRFGGDGTVDVVGGDMATNTVLTVAVPGGEAAATGGGGDGNTAVGDATVSAASVSAGAGFPTSSFTLDSAIVAAAGNGGTAEADAGGGDLTVGRLEVGDHRGSGIEIGASSGGDHCLCAGPTSVVVRVVGGNVSATTLVGLDARGGAATAHAGGGDGNVAVTTALTTAGVLTAGEAPARVTEETRLIAAAGDGGRAQARAGGGAITIGELSVGENTGSDMSVGGTGGDGDEKSALEVVVRGDLRLATTLAIEIDGGLAGANSSGGDGNVARTGVDSALPRLGTSAAVENGRTVTAGEGGTAASSAPGGVVLVGVLDAGDNTGGVIGIGDV